MTETNKIRLDGYFSFHQYPDGSKYIKKEGLGLPLMITYQINDYEDLWLLAHIKDIYDSYGQNCHLTIPFLLDGQADRRFAEGESFGLLLVARFINNLGFFRVNIFHPHNPAVEMLISNCKIIDNTYFIVEVLTSLGINNIQEDKDKLILMSTDAGGFKPLMKLADKINWQGETYSASKSRDHETHKLVQVIDRQDFGGKDVLLVDDICCRGNTFIGLAKLLKTKNVGKLYLAISHITIENPEPVLSEYFDIIYTTDSKFEKINLENVKIIKIF